MKKERIAILPRGLEGVCIDDARYEVRYFVGSGTAEETWARKFLPSEKITAYHLGKGCVFDKMNTEDVLRRTDIASCLRREGIGALMLTSRGTSFINAWAQKNGIRIIGTEQMTQQLLEDKLFFDAFMDAHGVPKPRSAVHTMRELRTLKAPIFKKGMVVQRRSSCGGEGTFFIRSAKELRTMLDAERIPKEERCLVREHIDGAAYGITVFVSADTVALSPLRMQCYYPGTCGGAKIFAGIQWVPTGSLESGLRTLVNKEFLRLGKLLHGMRFFGFANFDFLVSEGRIFVIECNPRSSAATPHLFLFPELLPGTDITKEFVYDHRKMHYRERPHLYRMPDSDLSGSFLEIVPSEAEPEKVFRIERACDIGIYRIAQKMTDPVAFDIRELRKKGSFFWYSEAKRGGKYKGKGSIGIALSSEPLFDPEGRMTDLGENVLHASRSVIFEGRTGRVHKKERQCYTVGRKKNNHEKRHTSSLRR